MQGVYVAYWFTSLLIYCNTSACVIVTSFPLQPCALSRRLNDHHLQLIVICCLQTQPVVVDWLLLPCLQTQPVVVDRLPSNSTKLRLSTLLQRTEARKTNNKQPGVSRDFQRLMSCSAVGLDVFNDPSFASSLQSPIAMKLYCAPRYRDSLHSSASQAQALVVAWNESMFMACW